MSKPTHLGFSIQPLNGRTGRTLTTVQAVLLDQWDNQVSDSSTVLKISIVSGPGTLSGTTTRTMSGGAVAFNDLKITNGSPGTFTYTLKVEVISGPASPMPLITSNSFTISP